MSHNQNAKLMVLDEIRKGTCIRTISEMSGIPYKTVWRWMNDSDDPVINENRVKNRYHHDQKTEILQLVETGRFTIPQIAAMKNIGQATIEEWIADKTRIRALYSSQGKHLMYEVKTSNPGKEASAMGTPDDKDTRQYIRDLKDENEFLKAKVAYLESLMELNGTPAASFKKKHNTRPSETSSEEGSGT